MSDHDNGDSTNGHSRHTVVHVDDERADVIERRLGQLAADVRLLQQSLDIKADRITKDQKFISDFLFAINQKLDEVLNNRDGYGVLKRLAALEERLPEKPKRVATRGRK